MHIYTFIVEFRNGTYCTQVEAINIVEATKCWIEKLKLEKKNIRFLGDTIIKKIETLADNDLYEANKIDGLVNVWFQHFPTSKGSFFINIVKTENRI